MVPDSFYRALEDRFRGEREDIKQRQSVYLPLIDALRERTEKPGLDIGCGRAEWLELLKDHGMQVSGIDLNADFVESARVLGLDVSQGDAIAFVRDLPPGELGFISAFHVVEHIDFSMMLDLLSYARSALDDHGFLLLETPNPANLTVGANTFYLDPTHERPLPPTLLAFAAEYAGFERAFVVPVNRHLIQNPLELWPADMPGATALNNAVGALNDTLMQAPDYAVVAFKRCDAAFEHIALTLVEQVPLPTTEHPVDVVALDRGAKQTEATIAEMIVRLDRAELALRQAHEAASASQQAAVDARHIADNAADISAKAHEAANLARETADRSYECAEEAQRKSDEALFVETTRIERLRSLADAREAELQKMRASSSWRVTAPLRAAGALRFTRLPGRAFARARLRSLIVRAAAVLSTRPRLKYRVLTVLSRFPRLHARLAGIAGSAGLVFGEAYSLVVEEPDQLGKRGRTVYDDLLQTRADTDIDV
ncbi:class I SAM-dependent methyltransferase [Caballeronia sp. LjRoot31]|uniref:class I SAM-dependent methyltransferase n=1 Tax=Caballeronia sp. LjRoot31 TaxID=3342324 RepID=UPI003ECE7587